MRNYLCYCLIIGCVLIGVANCTGEDYQEWDWENNLDDSWYSDELEKLGLATSNEESNINENDEKLESIETGEWDEELNIADLDTAEDVEKELQDRLNQTKLDDKEFDEYQLEDNRQQPYEDDQNDTDNIPEINIADIELYKPDHFNNVPDYEEDIKPLPLPPIGSIEDTINRDDSVVLNKYDNFDDMAAEESRQVEFQSNENFDNSRLESNENVDLQKMKDQSILNNDSASMELTEDKKSGDDMVIDETINILASLEDNFSDTKLEDDKSEPSSIENQENIEETKKILEGINDSFDESLDQKNKTVETEQFEDEDTLDQAKADLDADLDKLFSIWDKLSSDDEKTKSNENTDMENNQNSNGNSISNEVKDYEDKYNRPFREGIVLQNRQYDYYEDDASVAEDAYPDNLKDDKGADKAFDDKNKKDEYIDTDNVEYENIEDSNLSEIFAEFSKELVNTPNLEDDTINEKESDKDQSDVETIDSILLQKNNVSDDKLIPYTNDAIVDDGSSSIQGVLKQDSDNDSKEEKLKEPVPTKYVSDLSDDEYDALMSQFVMERDTDVNPVDCDGNPGPILITLTPNVPLELSSCNHPGAYPTNRVNEWIIQGDGAGMDIKLKKLDTNGIIGDYLMLKPGSLNANGPNGLLFSYHIDHERWYRFLDVNQLFVRFDVKTALAFRTGFLLEITLRERFTPSSSDGDDLEMETDAILPQETATVYVGGVNLTNFISIEEEFRMILADMATLYINTHRIDPGLNTTSQTTIITSRSICIHTWPDSYNCAKVTFGVPLVYEDETSGLTTEQLEEMWNSLSRQDPFAARLNRLGVSEFPVPNDSSMLSLWLVIAVGVLISAVMLAVALWRFSCFEDYTRMAPFSDSDSFTNEKRVLDLYPTPHQPLPPLYSDADYNWVDNKEDTTRVDMGGFANRSFVRDDMFNLDSDDEVTIGQRGNEIRPKDAYDV